MSELESGFYYRFIDELNNNFSYGALHPEYLAFIEKLKKSSKQNGCDLKELRKLVTLREEKISPADLPEQMFEYLGLADIKSNSGHIIQYENMLGRKILSRSAVFYRGDILFGRLRPYLNKIHLTEHNGICSTEFYVFTTNREIKSNFLVRYLLSELTLTQTKWLLTGNSYPRLSKDEFLNLKILVPEIKTQTHIVNKVVKLEKQSLQKKQKASNIIKQVYSIIPNAFSINIPKMKRYDYFALMPNEFDDRLDFKYNQKYFRDLYHILETSENACKLGNLLDPVRGLTNGVEIRNYVEDGTPYLRVGDVVDNKLDLDNVARVKQSIDDLTKDIKLSVGNLIVSRSGTLGITVLVDANFPLDVILSSHLIRVVLRNKFNDTKINPAYIDYYLKSKLGQLQFDRISYGTATPEINQTSLSNMRIILPDEYEQKRIVKQMEHKLKKASKYENISKSKWEDSRKMFIELLLE